MDTEVFWQGFANHWELSREADAALAFCLIPPPHLMEKGFRICHTRHHVNTRGCFFPTEDFFLITNFRWRLPSHVPRPRPLSRFERCHFDRNLCSALLCPPSPLPCSPPSKLNVSSRSHRYRFRARIRYGFCQGWTVILLGGTVGGSRAEFNNCAALRVWLWLMTCRRACPRGGPAIGEVSADWNLHEYFEPLTASTLSTRAAIVFPTSLG